jgi:hypothetical protein
MNEYREYVIQNQKIMQAIKDRVPGDLYVDKLFGTLDFATARFNTVLLKLSQDALLADEYAIEVIECKKAIEDFYKYTEKYRFGIKMLQWYYKIALHGIGTRRIPKIKKLLNKIETND